MNYIKLSFFIRSSESFWNFKKKEGISFWEKLEGELNKALEKLHVTQEKKGNFLHNYFICSEDSPETFKKIAEDIIKSFFDDENEAKFVTVSASLSSADEYNKQFPSAFKMPEKEGTFSKSESSDSDKTTNSVNQDGLVKHTEMLKNLKTFLLKDVKGQRNAVEQVVQSIFECEMFSSKDTKRKGPLATLLFTGPSGVGKTFLAELTAEFTGRKKLVVDMSDFAGYGSSGRFNGGGFGEDNLVTGFANDEPNGIIIFDEIEKANMSTIHLFLQILDFGRLMDHKLKKEVSFKNTIIIMTTNAGKSLYEDATVCDLSSVPRSVILDTLKTDIDPATREPFFPECIVTRMANGKVILFNHLEPFALMEIISDEVEKYINLFEISTGIKVNYDKKTLAALILYSGGGVADARSLRGLARSIVVKELQEVIMQLTYKNPEKVNALKSISITVDTDENEEVNNLFVGKERMYASIFSDKITDNIFDEKTSVNTHFEATNDIETFKKRLRGVVDYVLVDPLCGNHNVAHLPNDVEDFDSDGMFMFEYIREYFPEIPIYILDTSVDTSISFETLLARGARGIVRFDTANKEATNKTFYDLSFSALINNSAFSLGRSGKTLTYNCAQYITDDENATIS
ncbi:MAG: ATP-dependent Clp protease ATP-binding subunit, partial [Clostridia bacterium]|nr:ATP-dependent Clp protease ATP-binding subunit [Clostridia bacterium]